MARSEIKGPISVSPCVSRGEPYETLVLFSIHYSRKYYGFMSLQSGPWKRRLPPNFGIE